MTTKTIHANVTDTNHRQRGMMDIQVEFHQGNPVEVAHDGKTYIYTGKSGSNLRTDMPVREMATEEDARLWITLDGQQIWED